MNQLDSDYKASKNCQHLVQVPSDYCACGSVAFIGYYLTFYSSGIRSTTLDKASMTRRMKSLGLKMLAQLYMTRNIAHGDVYHAAPPQHSSLLGKSHRERELR